MQQIEVGDTFAGYRIIAKHSSGGMSTIYEATEPGLNRRVALKVIAPDLSSDERFRKRFTHEARQAASIDHPNIIPIYGFGEFNNNLYIAMRFVVGSDLRTLLRNKSGLEPARVVHLITQAAAALDAVHTAGMIHRDVKPANFLVARPAGDRGREHVYLADFGITRSESREPLTRAGEFIGTIAYASPEQLKNDELTAQSDVYALGCMAYECLTGTKPFQRDNNASVIYAHLSEVPPKPSEVSPGLSADVDAVIAAAMAKEPSMRPASAGAFALALQQSLGLPTDSLETGVNPADNVVANALDDDEETQPRDRFHELDRMSSIETPVSHSPSLPKPPTQDRRFVKTAVIAIAASILVAIAGFALTRQNSSNLETSDGVGVSALPLGDKIPSSSTLSEKSLGKASVQNTTDDTARGDVETLPDGGLVDDGSGDLGAGQLLPDSGTGSPLNPGGTPSGGDTPVQSGSNLGPGPSPTTNPGTSAVKRPSSPVGVQAYGATGLGEEDAQVSLRWNRSSSGGTPTSFDVTGTTYNQVFNNGCSGTVSVLSTVTHRVTSTSGSFRATKLKSACAWVKWEVRAVNAAGSSAPTAQTVKIPDIRGANWPYQIIRGIGAIALFDGNTASCGVAQYLGCGTTPGAGSSVTAGNLVKIWQQP